MESVLHTKSIIDRTDCFTLLVNDVNVGKCIIHKKAGKIWLKYIEIYKKYRGNNYSTKLWQFVENWLKDQQIKEIYLYTSEFADKQGKLVKLYNSWGFCILGKDIYEYNGEDLIRKVLMVKDEL
jgi:GNAT superfamily N-acetyltransferase